MFEIQSIQAEQGDALFVSYGDAANLRYLLIDGGVKESLANLMTVLEQARNHGRLRLEALVVTHYDDDHIQGIVALLKAKPAWLDIADIWFNGRRHLHAADILGHKDGDELTTLIDGIHPWNSAFKEGRICNTRYVPVELAGGMFIWVLSPDEERLRRLARHWKDAAPPKDISETPAADLLGRQDMWPLVPFSKYKYPPHTSDTSIPNGSSIALLLEFGESRALLAADAFAAVVKDSLLSRWKRPVKIDLLKVSHHGSKGNTDVALLQSLDCSRYLISTSGRTHVHPDQALIASIIAEKPGAEIIFNYEQDQTSKWRDAPSDWPVHKLTYPIDDEPYVKVSL